MTRILKTSLYLLIIYPFVFIIRKFFPSLNKFIKKAKLIKIKYIKEEQKENIKNNLLQFENKYQIKEYKQYFQDSIEKLSKKETHYFKNEVTNEYFYTKLHYIFRIIDKAKQAIIKLEEVNKDNRKIAYYESSKNASLDDLLNEYTAQLSEQDYKRITSTIGKREIKVKRLIARLRKTHTLFFNYYIVLLTFNWHQGFITDKEDQDAYFLFTNLFEFYRVGHATTNQIHKSVAIQIYNIYKDDFSENELKNIISKLISSSFDLNEDYQNFNNIVEQEPYLKNIIYDFPLFDSNTTLSNKQFKEINRFLVTSNLMFPKQFPRIIRRFYINLCLKNLLDYYQINDHLNFFGFKP